MSSNGAHNYPNQSASLIPCPIPQEYSADPFHFNRTQLHRGYCVSDRCPSPERNSSRRFEDCAAKWGRKKKLRLSLSSLKYCKTHAQEYVRKENPEPYDLSQKVLLSVVVALCLANVVGTIYDLFADHSKSKFSFIHTGVRKRGFFIDLSIFQSWILH